MKKKILSIVLAGTMVASTFAVGVVSASAEEGTGKAKGGYGTLGAYSNPTSGAILRKIMLAMPGAWQNDTTANEKCGGYGGVYWWGDNAYDAPDRVAGGHGWPGWRMDKETGESGVTNLFSINAPVYGNGEQANGPMLVFNNYLDGGTDDNPETNPFYEAACQASDFSAQYYSKNDLKKVPHFEKLFRYTYLKQAQNCGVDVSGVSMDSDTFWEDINKAAAAYNNANWDNLDEEEQTYQIDMVFDEQPDDLDFSEYGTYAGNFYNEDGDPNADDDSIVPLYPKEISNGDCLSFTFDNMVFVVDLDPANIKKNSLSQKLEFGGGIFFYYGNGEYGTWPTKELNKQFGGVLGNFMDQEIDEEAEAGQQIVKGAYLNSDYNTIKAQYDELHKNDPTDPPTTTAPNNNNGNGGNGGTGDDGNGENGDNGEDVDNGEDGDSGEDVDGDADGDGIPDPDDNDATSSVSSPDEDSNSANDANGAIATGQISFAVIVFVLLIAGVGAIYFTRRRTHK